MANNSILANLEPKSLFKFFEEILSIPRPSKHEEKMTEYLINWAKERNLEYVSDEIGNVIIRKGATKGKPVLIVIGIIWIILGGPIFWIIDIVSIIIKKHPIWA